MRRSVIFWLILACWLLPNKVWAYTRENWLIAGSQNELWSVEQDYISGYSQHHFTDSFLVTDPELVPVPEDFKFRFEFTPIRGIDHNFVWNFQDPENYYQAHFNGGAVWISRFIGGQEMLAVGKNFSISLGETYNIDLRQVGNRLTLLIDKQEIAAFNDLTHNDNSRGSVGFKLSPGAVIPVESRFSAILWHDAAITLIPINLFKQDDPLWADTEYDTASLWSAPARPTVGRWGCALTSLVMIMRYHGLTQMPDGQPVDPATVNQWLIDQEDGYVGQGLVNWFAGMRLVREISDLYSVPGDELPKLEFSYQGSPWRETAKNEILAERPLIAQVPGHFTVVNGYDERIDGFLISDPLYEYSYLSQHPSVSSLRLFKPSQTDLSALVIVHRAWVSVEINNGSGQIVSQTWQEEVADSLSGESTEAWRFTVVNRPADGEYKVIVEGAKEEGEVVVFSYDQLADVKTYLPLKSEYINFEIFNFSIGFNKETGGEILLPELAELVVFSWDSFLTKLNQLKDSQLINQSIYTRLYTLANLAAAAGESTWPRYKNYLINLLGFYSDEITEKVGGDLKMILK